MKGKIQKLKIPAIIAAVVLLLAFAVIWQISRSDRIIRWDFASILSKILWSSDKSKVQPAQADRLIVVSNQKPANFVVKPNPESTEVVALRTENSKTFDNHDGTYTYEGGVMAHYKDNSGSNTQWQEIDPTIYTDFPEYRLYDHLPFVVKVFKNKTGYEISSKTTDQKYLVELNAVEGVKTGKYENSADLNFEFEIKPNAVRLWKNILTEKAPKNFTWKITETGSGDLAFRENPEAFDLATAEPVKIETQKTPIDSNSFYWQEEAPRTGLKVDTDVTRTVAASSDDCQEITTEFGSQPGQSLSFELSATTIRLGEFFDSDRDEQDFYNGGFRFLNVTVPKSAEVTAATITLYVQLSTSNPALNIKGIAEDDTATWSAGSKPSDRSKTSAVAWQPIIPSGSITSPDIKTIIQAIVNRAGWASGHALGISIENVSYDFGQDYYKYYRSFDYGSSYPSLSITYTGGGSTLAPDTPKEKLEGKIKLEGNIKIE